MSAIPTPGSCAIKTAELTRRCGERVAVDHVDLLLSTPTDHAQQAAAWPAAHVAP